VDRQEPERLAGAHVLDVVVGNTRRDGCHVVAVRGELDLYTGPPVRRVFEEIAAQEPAASVVVDLDLLTFLDSSGLGVLISGLRRLRAGGGTLSLAGCRGAVAEVLAITGLHHAFRIFDTVAEAVSSSGRATGVLSARAHDGAR
jgi:anti-sigma B factor antagonist